MAAGRYVPDEVVIQIIADRITEEDCRDGFILDGFPRTVAQADALDHLLEDLGLGLDAAIHLKVDKEELLRRVTGRRICPTCKQEYHVASRPPQQDMLCDEDGTQLIQREDDKEATFRKRLEVYEEHTTPLVDYYARKGALQDIDGDGSFEEVFRRLLAVIED
jgi:adenylate kinase